MNPGEYIGKDGRTYRWKHERLSDNSAEGYDHQAHVHEWETEWIDPADWDDAKAALDALIEAESGEWVEWTWAGGKCRASADGSRVQMWDYCSEKWADATESRTGQAYRKGREVALEEAEVGILAARAGGISEGYLQGKEDCSACAHADELLRDAVRELVEAVNIYDSDLKRHGSVSRNDLLIAAKKVEAKL